jgi:hypothetical protein
VRFTAVVLTHSIAQVLIIVIKHTRVQTVQACITLSLAYLVNVNSCSKICGLRPIVKTSLPENLINLDTNWEEILKLREPTGRKHRQKLDKDSSSTNRTFLLINQLID